MPKWSKLGENTKERDFLAGPAVKGLPRCLSGKEPACSAGDVDSVLGLERSPGEGNGNPLQYSCLENTSDRGAWWAAFQGVAKETGTTEQVNNNDTQWLRLRASTAGATG